MRLKKNGTKKDHIIKVAVLQETYPNVLTLGFFLNFVLKKLCLEKNLTS